jgi:hypothetical protein
MLGYIMCMYVNNHNHVRQLLDMTGNGHKNSSQFHHRRYNWTSHAARIRSRPNYSEVIIRSHVHDAAMAVGLRGESRVSAGRCKPWDHQHPDV